MIYYVFTNELDKAKEYYDLLLELKENSILPQYYYVPVEAVLSGNKNKIKLLASPEVAANTPHLWTQAIFILSQLLIEKILTLQDLDPIRRYMIPSERPKQSKRYSSFKGFYSDLTINICCIAESVRLQQLLANYGITSQTPNQIEPIEIWSQSELVKAYELLGKNTKLQLTGRLLSNLSQNNFYCCNRNLGRPKRPIGTLGTSKSYRICSQRVIAYPLTFETNDFYMSSDLGLLLDDVKNDLEFLSKCWKLQGRPIYVFLIREHNLRGPQRYELLELLSQFKQGNINGISVRIERLQTLTSAGCSEHLDFINDDITDIQFFALKEIETDNSRYKSLSELPKEMKTPEYIISNSQDYSSYDLNQLIIFLNSTNSRLQKAFILHELLTRYGMNMQIDDKTVEEFFEELGNEAVRKYFISSVLSNKLYYFNFL